MRTKTILILGEHVRGHDVHDRTRDGLLAAARDAGLMVNTRWMGAEDIALYPGLVTEADGVVLVPSVKKTATALPLPLISALETIRTRGIPFLATGRAHALVFLEVARNVLGIKDATGSGFPETPGTLVVQRIDERQRHGERLGDDRRRVKLEPVRGRVTPYGDVRSVTEITDQTEGVSPDYAHAIEDTGLLPLLLDSAGGRPFLHGRDGVCQYVAAFLPQLAPSPHPLVRALVDALR